MELTDLIRFAIREDAGDGDHTSLACVTVITPRLPASLREPQAKPNYWLKRVVYWQE